MNDTENRNAAEMHGCLVCGRLFNLLVVYTSQGDLVDCAVTSPGGQRVLDEKRPLVACETHPAEQIEAAHKRWQARQDALSDQKDEPE